MFDPSGTLTGGSRPQTASILAKLGELCEAEAALQHQDAALREVGAELESIQAEAAKYEVSVRGGEVEGKGRGERERKGCMLLAIAGFFVDTVKPVLSDNA